MTKGEVFPPDVVLKLKYYVYRLIDPRNGETFYVGKGQANRVFAHIHDELSQEGDELSDKLKRIREVRVAGFEVAHVIHRHGMDEATAFEVEAAVMDAYPGLSNIAGGTGSSDYGAMHAREIIRRYSAAPAEFRHKAILISVNRGRQLPRPRGCAWTSCIRRTRGPSRAASGVCREARPRRIPKARRRQPDQVHLDQVSCDEPLDLAGLAPRGSLAPMEWVRLPPGPLVRDVCKPAVVGVRPWSYGGATVSACSARRSSMRQDSGCRRRHLARR
jgi:hypothetical protein